MKKETVKNNDNKTKQKSTKIEKMETRWRELYREGKRGVAILDILCDEFYYTHRCSIYRVIDVSQLKLEMKK